MILVLIERGVKLIFYQENPSGKTDNKTLQYLTVTSQPAARTTSNSASSVTILTIVPSGSSTMKSGFHRGVSFNRIWLLKTPQVEYSSSLHS